MGLKKELASIHLFELHFLNFLEPASRHTLNRNSTDVYQSLIDSLLSESTSPLRRRGCTEFWLVQGLEGGSILNCYHSYM